MIDYKYLYETYFQEFEDNQKEDKEFFKQEIISVLKATRKEFKYLKDSKISINQYVRDIKRIEKLKNELQQFSEETIYIKLPPHPSEIFYYMNNYLVNEYKIPSSVCIDVFLYIYGYFYGSQKLKKPKVITSIKEMEKRFSSLPKIISEMNKEWENHCKKNKGKSLQEKKKTFLNK